MLFLRLLKFAIKELDREGCMNSGNGIFKMRFCKLRGSVMLKAVFFCLFLWLLLFLNFYTNCFHSAEQSWFTSFDQNSERYIIGRLIKSRQDGIFSSGGLSILGVTDEAASKDPWSFATDKLDHYAVYSKNERIDYFAPPYYSQICGQGIFFSMLDAILPCAPSVKLRIFYALASMLTALVISAVIAWFYVEFGLFAGVTVLAFALASQWLTVFARNLWWSTWAFYLPMALVMLYIQYKPQKRQDTFFRLGSMIFFSVLLKTIFNGYEYITTTLVMMTVPFIYYGWLNHESFSSVCGKLCKSALCAGFAIALSVGILNFQIASVSGNFLAGFNHLTYTLGKRTQDIDETITRQFHPANIKGLQASTLSVMHRYLQGGFWSIAAGVCNPNSSKPHRRYSVTYASLIGLFIVMTGALYLTEKRCAARRDRRAPALIIAFWFSILAPLSWFVIFKAHSYSHLALNFIVWQMPFTFFGAAVTGLAVRNGFSCLYAALRKPLVSKFRCS